MQTTHERASLANLIERVRVGMLTTIDPAGVPHACPLQTLEFDDDSRLWLLISASAAAIEAMNRELGRVAVAYADPNKQDYASLSGSGMIVRDDEKIRAHWNAWVELWFPQGIDAAELALLCVSVERAEYWEAPGSAACRIHGLARARMPGDETSAWREHKNLQTNP